MKSIAVVKLDDARFGSGPATVIEVSDEPIRQIIARYTDRDGARDRRLRFWEAHESTRVGQRVETMPLVRGTGRPDWAKVFENPVSRSSYAVAKAAFRRATKKLSAAEAAYASRPTPARHRAVRAAESAYTAAIHALDDARGSL
jgi:hypothetical protein